jgi:hypothetical protein
MSENGRPAHHCQDTTKDGLPCPANARRRPDPDGKRRCPQHTLEPSVREAIRISRSRGAFKAIEVMHAGPVLVGGERYLTAESLDVVFDEAINTLRTELRARKSSKPQVATAIAAMAEAKVKIRQLAWMANAHRRLNPVRETPA